MMLWHMGRGRVVASTTASIVMLRMNKAAREQGRDYEDNRRRRVRVCSKSKHDPVFVSK